MSLFLSSVTDLAYSALTFKLNKEVSWPLDFYPFAYSTFIWFALHLFLTKFVIEPLSLVLILEPEKPVSVNVEVVRHNEASTLRNRGKGKLTGETSSSTLEPEDFEELYAKKLAIVRSKFVLSAWRF
ncbi:hypothetical protein HK096_004728, partial [Nowakowskiella sp. JEL0078]